MQRVRALISPWGCAAGALECGSSSYRLWFTRQRCKAVAAATALQGASRIFTGSGCRERHERPLCDLSWTCADCDKIPNNECSSQTTACEGGCYLLPFGVPGPPSLAVDASSTPVNGVHTERIDCGQSRRFAATPARGHGVDLQRVSDRPPQSGAAGDRISGVARRDLGIPPASFLPDRLSFLPVERCALALASSLLVCMPGRGFWPPSLQLTS